MKQKTNAAYRAARCQRSDGATVAKLMKALKRGMELIEQALEEADLDEATLIWLGQSLEMGLVRIESECSPICLRLARDRH